MHLAAMKVEQALSRLAIHHNRCWPKTLSLPDLRLPRVSLCPLASFYAYSEVALC